MDVYYSIQNDNRERSLKRTIHRNLHFKIDVFWNREFYEYTAIIRGIEIVGRGKTPEDALYQMCKHLQYHLSNVIAVGDNV